MKKVRNLGAILSKINGAGQQAPSSDPPPVVEKGHEEKKEVEDQTQSQHQNNSLLIAQVEPLHQNNQENHIHNPLAANPAQNRMVEEQKNNPVNKPGVEPNQILAGTNQHINRGQIGNLVNPHDGKMGQVVSQKPNETQEQQVIFDEEIKFNEEIDEDVNKPVTNILEQIGQNPTQNIQQINPFNGHGQQVQVNPKPYKPVISTIVGNPASQVRNDHPQPANIFSIPQPPGAISMPPVYVSPVFRVPDQVQPSPTHILHQPSRPSQVNPLVWQQYDQQPTYQRPRPVIEPQVQPIKEEVKIDPLILEFKNCASQIYDSPPFQFLPQLYDKFEQSTKNDNTKSLDMQQTLLNWQYIYEKYRVKKEFNSSPDNLFNYFESLGYLQMLFFIKDHQSELSKVTRAQYREFKRDLQNKNYSFCTQEELELISKCLDFLMDCSTFAEALSALNKCIMHHSKLKIALVNMIQSKLMLQSDLSEGAKSLSEDLRAQPVSMRLFNKVPDKARDYYDNYVEYSALFQLCHIHQGCGFNISHFAYFGPEEQSWHEKGNLDSQDSVGVYFLDCKVTNYNLNGVHLLFHENLGQMICEAEAKNINFSMNWFPFLQLARIHASNKDLTKSQIGQQGLQKFYIKQVHMKNLLKLIGNEDENNGFIKDMTQFIIKYQGRGLLSYDAKQQYLIEMNQLRMKIIN